ncbi:SirB2 family protein [Motilimonas pumila]|uniref:Regulator SirB n=1 Tax=Motilimonas pumila TaxID=2303987 RepID=A0A418YJJ7_9GAMM|nr:SirB2 family protein [Motilimonas pumila]RJG50654.1 regulator SirB [Motilimonas pumila]
MDYLILKHSHMVVVYLSLGLFVGRFLLSVKKPNWLQKKWLMWLCHGNDTLLLVLGGLLCYQLHIWPWQVSWLAGKLLLLLVYIVLGSFAIKRAKQPWQKWAYAFAALACFTYMLGMAINKSLYSWMV